MSEFSVLSVGLNIPQSYYPLGNSYRSYIQRELSDPKPRNPLTIARNRGNSVLGLICTRFSNRRVELILNAVAG